MKPKISIIIPTYCSKDRHDWSRLYLSLLGFSHQTLPKDTYEIIVVDDGSEWDIQKLVKEWNIDCNINVYRQHHQGICSAYLTGLNLIKSDYVFLGIDDNIPAPILLEEHLKDHLTSDNIVVWGREYHMRQMKKIYSPISGAYIANNISNNQESIHESVIDPEDVTTGFEKLVTKSIITEKYQDIENVLESSNNLKNITAPWLVMRLGNQSLSINLLKNAGGLDENFNPSGWYMDLELGLRLFKVNAKFKLNKKAEMIHISHQREAIALQDECEKHQYFYSKHPYLSVALCPLFFKSQMSINEYSKFVERVGNLKKNGVFK